MAALKKVLTDRELAALKPAPAGKRYVVWDAQQPHLGVRVTAKATKDGKAEAVSFIVCKRPAGSSAPVMVTLGRYPEMKLAKARELAPGVLGTLSEGRSPAEAEAERRRAEARRRADTFATAVEKFIEHEKARGLRSWHETEATLRRDFLGQEQKRGRDGARWTAEWTNGTELLWRGRPIVGIARRDVVERLDAIKAERGKHAARHALSAVRKLFNWAEEGERFGIEESAAARVRDKTLGITGRDLKRSRVLTDAELRDVWAAGEAIGYPFGPLVRMLILTGQRLSDIAQARRGEIDLDAALLTVPPERFKTGVAQEVPLAPMAVEILSALPRFTGAFVFTTSGGARPFSSFSKGKRKLDAVIAKVRKTEGREAMAPWTLHDLRRTVRTRLMSDCGVDAFTAERCLGHALPGLHGVYDQGTHRDQKRAALDKWAAALARIVGLVPGPGAGIVPAEEVEQRRRRRA